MKYWWEKESYEVKCRIAEGIPSYHEEPADQMLKSPPSESTSSHHPGNGSSFMFRCTSQVDKVCHHCPGGTYLETERE